MPAREFPAHPDLEQLKRQAKELLRDAHNDDQNAVADFREFHPESIEPRDAKLSDAQLVIARSYGSASWPRFAATCEVIEALTQDDFTELRTLVTAHPELFASLDEQSNRNSPLANAASASLFRVVAKLRENGARNFSELVANPALNQFIDAMHLLGRAGARFPNDAVGGAVESLNESNFAFMIKVGTPIEDENGSWRSRVALALETYARNPAGKHTILEVMAARGVPLPDTPTMAVHRGRLDLLQRLLQRDPQMLTRTFSHEEFFPPDLGCHADHSLALGGAQLGGAALLHMAVEYEELDIVQWLLDQGTPVDVAADIDATGFGGHTALFNCVITYNAGHRDERIARLLLQRGANPNFRASLQKKLSFAKDPSLHEYRNVTPLGLGQTFHDQGYVSQSALHIIAEFGGTA